MYFFLPLFFLVGYGGPKITEENSGNSASSASSVHILGSAAPYPGLPSGSRRRGWGEAPGPDAGRQRNPPNPVGRPGG